MKLETSQDLLNRLMAKHRWSWYRMAKELPAHENTVYSWKGGHTIVDRKFAPRIAELLGEPAEYVLAILEAEREQSAEVLKVWKRIAERFRSTASILLVGLALLTVHGKASAAVSDVGLVGNSQIPNLYIMRNRGRSRRRMRNLVRCLKTLVAAPLLPPCAGNHWRGSPPRSWPRSAACI